MPAADGRRRRGRPAATSPRAAGPDARRHHRCAAAAPGATAPGPECGGNGRNGGWLSDLLTRASREDSPPIAPPGPRKAPQRGTPQRRDNVELAESLAVDVARMIDHEAAADLWERYKRGERGMFSRRLYTAPGQKAFDEIRRKYRSDPEFRQTVEQYIHEFERLLDDVAAQRSRSFRGAELSDF